MEYINYIGEDVDLHLSNYSDAEFLPGSMKNIYNNENHHHIQILMLQIA